MKSLDAKTLAAWRNFVALEAARCQSSLIREDQLRARKLWVRVDEVTKQIRRMG